MDIQISFFPMALDPLVDPRGSCHKILPPSVMRRQQGVSWRGDWFMGTDITTSDQKLQKNNFFMKFLDSILLSEKQSFVRKSHETCSSLQFAWLLLLHRSMSMYEFKIPSGPCGIAYL